MHEPFSSTVAEWLLFLYTSHSRMPILHNSQNDSGLYDLKFVIRDSFLRFVFYEYGLLLHVTIFAVC